VGQKPSPDLADYLKALRERHKVSIGILERRMDLPKDTYRHIERHRRPLPDFQHGLIEFVRLFLRSVGATPEEEREVLELASRDLVRQFSEWMDDLRQRGVTL
jgi:Helix-turn-helix domain